MQSTFELYNKMFNSGIRINIGDSIEFPDLEDAVDGELGGKEKFFANSWIDYDYQHCIFICKDILFCPVFVDGKQPYMEVTIELGYSE